MQSVQALSGAISAGLGRHTQCLSAPYIAALISGLPSGSADDSAQHSAQHFRPSGRDHIAKRAPGNRADDQPGGSIGMAAIILSIVASIDALIVRYLALGVSGRIVAVIAVSFIAAIGWIGVVIVVAIPACVHVVMAAIVRTSSQKRGSQEADYDFAHGEAFPGK